MLLGMTACNKEEHEGILRLEIEHYNYNSKLHLDDDFAVWDNDDEVSINGTSYQIAIDNSSSKATIAGVPEAETYSAVYPAEWARDNFSIEYPQEQTYEANKVKAPMAAYTDGNNLKFKNLGSLLTLNVTNSSTTEAMNVQMIEVSASNGSDPVPLCGTFGISTDDYSLGTPTSTTNSVFLICNGVNIAAGGHKTFHIALPPLPAGTKLTVTIYDDIYYHTRTQGSTAQVSYARNQLNAVPFKTAGAITIQHTPKSNEIWYKIDHLSSSIFFLDATKSFNPATGWWVATYTNNREIKYITKDMVYNSSADPSNKHSLTHVKFPSSVTQIRDDAFSGFDGLTMISMPGVTQVWTWAFSQCSALTNVWMPNVTEIKEMAFSMYPEDLQVYCKNPNPSDAGAFDPNNSPFYLYLPKEYENSSPSWGSQYRNVVIDWYTKSQYETAYIDIFTRQQM